MSLRTTFVCFGMVSICEFLKMYLNTLFLYMAANFVTKWAATSLQENLRTFISKFSQISYIYWKKKQCPLSKKEISSLLFFIHKTTKISDFKIRTYILHRTILRLYRLPLTYWLQGVAYFFKNNIGSAVLENSRLLLQPAVPLPCSHNQISNFTLFVNQLKSAHGIKLNIFISCSHDLWRWNRQIVPKRWHIKFSRRRITQKNTTFTTRRMFEIKYIYNPLHNEVSW